MNAESTTFNTFCQIHPSVLAEYLPGKCKANTKGEPWHCVRTSLLVTLGTLLLVLAATYSSPAVVQFIVALAGF